MRELTATEKQQLRERLDTRSRKHISVLRQQREELNKKGPRTRIEKSATADRKGRAVTVERIAPAKPDRDPDKNSRNARRFDALRDNRSWGGSRSSLSSLTHLPDTIGAAAQTFVTSKVDINIQTAHMPQTIKQKTAPTNIQEIRNLPMCLARRNG